MQRLSGQTETAGMVIARGWLVNGRTVLNNKGVPVRQFRARLRPRLGCSARRA